MRKLNTLFDLEITEKFKLLSIKVIAIIRAQSAEEEEKHFNLLRDN